MDSILSLNNVVKRYHNHVAVDGVSFEIKKGTVFGLLGPNGAGKTSLIRVITGITGADEGNIKIDGEKLNFNHPGQIGYMPEERGLYKKMKVGEQLMYLSQLRGLSAKDSKAAISKWMEKFEFDPVMPASIAPRIFFTQAIIVYAICMAIIVFPFFHLRKLEPVKAMRE